MFAGQVYSCLKRGVDRCGEFNLAGQQLLHVCGHHTLGVAQLDGDRRPYLESLFNNLHGPFLHRLQREGRWVTSICSHAHL